MSLDSSERPRGCETRNTEGPFGAGEGPPQRRGLWEGSTGCPGAARVPGWTHRPGLEKPRRHTGHSRGSCRSVWSWAPTPQQVAPVQEAPLSAEQPEGRARQGPAEGRAPQGTRDPHPQAGPRGWRTPLPRAREQGMAVPGLLSQRQAAAWQAWRAAGLTARSPISPRGPHAEALRPPEPKAAHRRGGDPRAQPQTS